MNLPNNLLQKLSNRELNGEYRRLVVYPPNGTDFFSNDYLGLAKKKNHHETQDLIAKNGSTGSRLISGNSDLYNQTEAFLADFYQTETALLFASGYLANVGLLSALPQQEDTILFDQYCHASLRDGIRLNRAKSVSFQHNDYQDLEQKLQSIKGNCFVVVESLYSMDGDFCDLKKTNDLCEKYNAYLIIDEAHSTGIYGVYGQGLCANKNLNRVIARVHTFGKAAGSHGAVVVGSCMLKEFLVNFCRPFIYTTGLPDISLLEIKHAHEKIKYAESERENLRENIFYFQSKIKSSQFSSQFINSVSPIQVLIGEKSFLKEKESVFLQNLVLVKAIYSPSVQRNKERIRICLHSFNTKNEMDAFFTCL
jgi:8-amino-7-oxononanoate synthase